MSRTGVSEAVVGALKHSLTNCMPDFIIRDAVEDDAPRIATLLSELLAGGL